jgi:hypothetical protein
MPDFLDEPKHRQPSRPAEPHAERRRSPRWGALIPVFVYGHTGLSGQAPFFEEAYSVVVSDCGALLIMTTDVPVGEKLLLTNKSTELEQECRVASAGRRDGPSIEIAVEFDTFAPHFWRITAPPLLTSSTPPVNSRRRAL